MKSDSCKPAAMQREIKSNRRQKTMKSKHKEPTAKTKLYWGHSEYGWLLGTEPMCNSYEKWHKTQVEEFSQMLLGIGGAFVCVAFDDAAWNLPTITKNGALLKYPK